MTGIYCVDTVEKAKQQVDSLQSYESIITQDGVWLGKDWIKVSRSSDSKSGVLQREKELRNLKQRRTLLQNENEHIEAQLDTTELDLIAAEADRESLQQRDKILGSEYSTKSAQFSAYSAKQEQQQQRLNQISFDIEEIVAEISEIAETKEESEELKNVAEETIEQLFTKKESLEEEGEILQSQQHSMELAVNEAQSSVHSVQSQIESLKASESLTGKQIERLQVQNQQSAERIAELELKLNSTLSPLDDEKIELDQLSENKQNLEEKLQSERVIQQEIGSRNS